MDSSKSKRKQYKRKWMNKARAMEKHACKQSTFHDGYESSSDNEQHVNVHISCRDHTNIYRNGDKMDTQFDLANTHQVHQESSGSSSNGIACSDDTTNSYNKQWDWDLIDNHITLSSDSENEAECNNVKILAEDLSTWANENQIKHNAVDKLLKILRQHGNTQLPSTARTLLQTKKHVETKMKSNMEYYYFGIEDELRKNLHRFYGDELKNCNTIDISLNIDGLPLFKSSGTALWPVLCAINLNPRKVFPVVLTLGRSKPQNLEFLNDLIQVLNLLLCGGLLIEEQIFRINLTCIVCDAPAKAMVKGIKLYSGYFGCDKCNQSGVWKGRMTFPETENFQNRTDESFRNQSQHEHHHHMSPFCNLQINMVKAFPIDYMHQACLGVMKRLLLVRTSRTTSAFIPLGASNQVQTTEFTRTWSPNVNRTLQSSDVHRIQSSVSPDVHRIQSSVSPDVHRIQSSMSPDVQRAREVRVLGASSQVQTPKFTRTWSPNVNRTLQSPDVHRIQSSVSPDVHRIQSSVSPDVHRIQSSMSPDVHRIQSSMSPDVQRAREGIMTLDENLPQLAVHSRRRTDQVENTDTVIKLLSDVVSNQQDMILMLRQLTLGRSSTEAIIEDLVPNPAQNSEELKSIEEKVDQDPEFKKKLVNFLAALGGVRLSESVRKMLRTLGSNSLWSGFSLRGKKAKKPFIESPLMKCVKRACLKIHQKAMISEIEEAVAETLKHAPSQKDGPKYKKKRTDAAAANMEEDSE